MTRVALALGSGGARRTALTAVARPTVVPLSYAQQRMWFLNRFEATAAYNIPMAVRLSGALDVDALASVAEGAPVQATARSPSATLVGQGRGA